jgi:hypothetical protein
MEDDRRPYEDTKRLCTDLCYPERMSSWEWLSSLDGSHKGGRKYKNYFKRVHDGTPKYAFGVWVNGILGQFFPRHINWFKGSWSDRNFKDEKAIIKWLQDNDDFFIDTLNSSGSTGCDNDYYNQKRWTLGDAGCIGDSHVFIERDKITKRLLFKAIHPKNVWVKRDIWGREIAKHYKMSYTVEELVEEFGKEALAEKQKHMINTDEGKKTSITVIYAIYKNKDYQPERPGVHNMAYQVGYCNMDGEKMIPLENGSSQDGRQAMNPVSFSMRRPAEDNYGLGLVYSNLLECLTIDEIGKTLLRASQVAVNKPILASSAITNRLNLTPGYVNKVDTKTMQGVKMGDLITSLIDGNGFPFGMEQYALWQDVVHKRFGVNIFKALSSQENLNDMRVFVAQQLKAEEAVLLSPQLSEISGTTDNEFDRIYELVADDAPEPPAELTQGRIDIDYIGPLVQNLKQYYESGSLLTTVGYIREVLSIAPDSKVVYDGDELMSRIMRSTNCPEDCINSAADIQELRAINAQLAEQERQARLVGEASKAIPNMAAKIDKDSVLGKMEAA